MAEVVQENITPLFRPSCGDCDFCDGLRDMDYQGMDGAPTALRLEEEENIDSFEDSGSRPKTMKGGRRNDRQIGSSN